MAASHTTYRAGPARVILAPHRFGRGRRCGPAEVSPRLGGRARAALARWLEALPPEFAARLPAVKLAAGRGLRTPAREEAHAAAFIPQGYLVLDESLFARPGELGRILYHELCHFVWPRLRRGRPIYEAVIAREIEARVKGELGYSAALAKRALRGAAPPGSSSRPAADARRWRHYLCESFCDTGACALLRHARYRGGRHPEWTVARAALAPRLRAWRAALGWPGSSKLTVPIPRA